MYFNKSGHEKGSDLLFIELPFRSVPEQNKKNK